MNLGTGLAKVGSALKKTASTSAGKIALTGAAVGGGTYLAASGVSSGIEKLGDATGLNDVGKAITNTTDAVVDTSKGVGTLLGIGILIVLAFLVLFVFVPKARKRR